MRGLLLSAALLAAALTPMPAYADINLWIDDVAGNIGLVDVTTQSVVPGSVHSTGQALTDIAFIGNQMYGTTFSQLFRIDSATGAATLVGTYNVGAAGMNALVGNGASLLAASNATSEVYSINPATAAGANFAPSILPSAGDLAFDGGNLFLSAIDTTGGDSLVNVTAGVNIGNFVGVPNEPAVFGLANDGSTTYAVDGTEVFTLNTATALLTPLFDYGGAGLRAAIGTAFIAEGPPGVPEPSTWAMMLLGFAGLGYIGFKRASKITLA